MGVEGVVVLSKASWSLSPSMLQLTPAVPRGQQKCTGASWQQLLLSLSATAVWTPDAVTLSGEQQQSHHSSKQFTAICHYNQSYDPAKHAF